MSIYDDFEARLDSEKLERPSSREASIVLTENAGGSPLLGIQYVCDFRSEEETGSGKMAETFTQAADPKSFFAKEYLLQKGNRGLNPHKTQADLVFENDELIAFSADTYVYDTEREFKAGLAYVRQAASWSSGRYDLRQKYWRKQVAELKAEAKSRGLKGYSKLRSEELINLLADDDFAKANPDSASADVYKQAGWFHYGSLLIFEKKEGLFGEILQRLVEAAKAGYLVVGSGGGNPFGQGFSLFDSRDLTEESKDAISESNRWYREQMDLLEPVAEVVKAGPMKSNWGSAYYFLGKPTVIDGQVKYWLNGNSVNFPNGRNTQPSGYYTLQELLDEKYMADAAVKSDDSFMTFKDGNYRTTKLTEKEAEEELKALGLRWASK